MIIPALLLNWLKLSYIKPRFIEEAKKVTGKDTVDIVLETTIVIAKSTTILMGGRVLADDRWNIS